LVADAPLALRPTALPGSTYVAAPESPRLRVSARSFGVALAPLPPLPADALRWRIDWLWLRLVAGGLLGVYDLPPGDRVMPRLLLRRFEPVATTDRWWIGRARARALPPLDLDRALARPPVDWPTAVPPALRPVQVDAPPSPAAIAATLASLDLAGRFARRWAPDRPPHAVPPLPIRPGHLALQLACGDVDGVVGAGPHRHLVHGQVTRTPVMVTHAGVQTQTDHLRVVITAVDTTGELRTLIGEEEVAVDE